MTNDGVGLPVRLHDLLLALAGRVDDDALTQARELLAVAELDRAVELVVGCLLAGRIPVSPEERHEFGWLLGEVRSDRALADRLFAVERVPVVKHRFTVESDPAERLGEVLGKTVSVLPDVRGVRATWRSTPAGATPGPLPQRVVLVDIGPSGFAPATAYRVDTVLRKAGIRAAVEVLTVGTQLGEYHAAAVTTAREVFFSSGSTSPQPPPDPAAWFDGEVRDQAPVVEPEPVPVEPQTGSKSRRARVESYEGVQPFPPKPVRRLPAREPAEAVRVDEVDDVHGDDRADSVRADNVRADNVRADSGRSDVRADNVRADSGRSDSVRSDNVRAHDVRVDSAHADDVRVDDVQVDEVPAEDFTEAPVEPQSAVEEPAPVASPAFAFAFPDDHPLSRAEVTTELNPEDLAMLQAALADGQAPAAVQLPPTVDAKLSDRERALLQQLHEELAQREQQAWPAGPEFVNGVPKPTNGKYQG